MKTLIASSALLLAPLAARAATTYTYDLTSTFSSNQSLNTDGWNDASGNWKASPFTDPSSTSGLYARNNTGGDSTTVRANDGSFSFTIPSGTPRIELTITARTVAFWQAGLAQGGTSRLGMGGDFGGSGQFFIFDNFTRHTETGTSVAAVDSYQTLRLDFDLVAGTADLILDPDGANTLLIDDVSMGVPVSTVEGTNALFVRAAGAFAGPTRITLSVIPEPGAVALGGLAAVGLLLRRRRR